jgi:3-isopropylmalate/(R)-2-methylmalate dehydratase large subunit
MYQNQNPEDVLIHVAGDLQLGVTPKDVALYILKTIHSSATGYFVEYAGKVLKT